MGPCGWIACVAAVLLVAGCITNQSPTGFILPSVPEALIWAQPYENLTVIVEYVDGQEPTVAVLETMLDTLEEVTDKHSIRLEGPKVIPGIDNDPDRVWTDDEVRALVDAQWGAHGAGEGHAAILHITYLNGLIQRESGHTRGLSMENSVLIFPKTFRETSFGKLVPRPGAEVMERRVLIHEVGHSLGLVGCGIPMLTNRMDPDSKCHSTERESVMYDLDSDLSGEADGAAMLDGKLISYRFSEADLKDLAAFREEGRERARAAGR